MDIDLDIIEFEKEITTLKMEGEKLKERLNKYILKEKDKKYYKQNKEACKARLKNYYKQNKEACKARVKKYQEENKPSNEKKRIYTRTAYLNRKQKLKDETDKND